MRRVLPCCNQNMPARAPTAKSSPTTSMGGASAPCKITAPEARAPAPAIPIPAKTASPSRPSGLRRMLTSSSLIGSDEPCEQESTTAECRQVIVNQFRVKALEQDERPDDPAQEKAKSGIGFTAAPRLPPEPPG